VEAAKRLSQNEAVLALQTLIYTLTEAGIGNYSIVKVIAERVDAVELASALQALIRTLQGTGIKNYDIPPILIAIAVREDAVEAAKSAQEQIAVLHALAEVNSIRQAQNDQFKKAKQEGAFLE